MTTKRIPHPMDLTAHEVTCQMISAFVPVGLERAAWWKALAWIARGCPTDEQQR